MRFLLAVMLVTGLVTAADRVGPPSAYPQAGIGRWDPAVTQANLKTTVCASGYTAVIRAGKGGGFGAITEKIKRQVYARDHKAPVAGKCCEIDHFFPLELGGANEIDNLWAESWNHPYGARDKDQQVEDKLHRLLCAGKITLYEAQHCIATDWVACAAKIKYIK